MAVTEGTNSYVSLDSAETYFGNRLYVDAWANASSSESEKELSLIWACSLLENRVRWYGYKTNSSQTLQWPRRGLVDRYGKAVDSSTIPQAVKDVQCELALFLLEHNPLVISNGIEKMNLEGLELDLQANRQVIPWKIFKPISIYGQVLDGASTTRLTR